MRKKISKKSNLKKSKFGNSPTKLNRSTPPNNQLQVFDVDPDHLKDSNRRKLLPDGQADFPQPTEPENERRVERRRTKTTKKERKKSLNSHKRKKQGIKGLVRGEGNWENLKTKD